MNHLLNAGPKPAFQEREPEIQPAPPSPSTESVCEREISFASATSAAEVVDLEALHSSRGRSLLPCKLTFAPAPPTPDAQSAPPGRRWACPNVTTAASRLGTLCGLAIFPSVALTSCAMLVWSGVRASIQAAKKTDPLNKNLQIYLSEGATGFGAIEGILRFLTLVNDIKLAQRVMRAGVAEQPYDNYYKNYRMWAVNLMFACGSCLGHIIQSQSFDPKTPTYDVINNLLKSIPLAMLLWAMQAKAASHQSAREVHAALLDVESDGRQEQLHPTGDPEKQQRVLAQKNRLLEPFGSYMPHLACIILSAGLLKIGQSILHNDPDAEELAEASISIVAGSIGFIYAAIMLAHTWAHTKPTYLEDDLVPA